MLTVTPNAFAKLAGKVNSVRMILMSANLVLMSVSKAPKLSASTLPEVTAASVRPASTEMEEEVPALQAATTSTSAKNEWTTADTNPAASTLLAPSSVNAPKDSSATLQQSNAKE